MRILFAAVLLACSCPAWADFDDFGPRRIQRALFSMGDDEAKIQPKPAPSEAAPPEAAPPEEREEAEPPHKPRHHHAGHASVAFWATPFMRFTEDPTGVGVGFGFEFSHMVDERFGTMFSMSIWSIDARMPEVPGNDDREDVNCVDIELGSRFHALNWRSGRMYMDLRFVIGFADGPAPVRSSTYLGGDMRWGFEFGDESVRTFLEAGMGFRGAVNHGDAGWVETGGSNGSGGMFFDLLRVGMRLYF